MLHESYEVMVINYQKLIFIDIGHNSLWIKVLYMTRMDWVDYLTQSVLNVSIKFDTWNNIENCTVLE